MPDQFAELKPGDRLPGIPSQPWNKFLELLKPDLGGTGADARGTSAVEVQVSNETSAALDVYSIVSLTALNGYAVDPDTWLAADVFAGGTPTATSAIAILQNGLGPGQVGRARLAGRTACQVNLTDLKHLYAVPTTSSVYLQSAASGPACIVALEHDWTATGPQWAVVILGGVAGGAGFARFTLAATLATTDASQAGCTVDESWGGQAAATITVYNLPASTGYIFYGAAGHKGLATFDAPAGKWWIVQLECGTAPGGGGGGFTGTIGN
jgi:hypothetical protein